MKKITLLIMVSLLSFLGYGQLPNESFEDAWVTQPNGYPAAPPGGWIVVKETATANTTWVRSPFNSTAITPHSGSYAAYLDREGACPTCAAPKNWLISKSFNLPENGELHFWSRLTIAGAQGGVYKVKYLLETPGSDPYDLSAYVDLGTWSDWTLNPTQTEYFEKVITMPNVTGNVRVAFVMEAANQDRWLIDDVSCTSVCAAPTGVVASNPTLSTITLNWTNNSSAQKWRIEVLPADGTPTENGGIIYEGASPQYVYGLNAGETLTADTNYKVYIQAICPDGGKSTVPTPTFFKTGKLGQTCNDPIVIPSALPYTTSNNTTNFADVYEGIPGTGCNAIGSYLDGNDVVYRYTPAVTGNIYVSVTGNTSYTGMFVYANCANIGTSCIAGVTVSFTAAPLIIPSLAVTAGTPIYIVISSTTSSQTTPYTLSLQQVNCAAPTGASVSATTQNSATLSWTAGAYTEWQVAVQNVGSGLPAGAGQTVTTVTPTVTQTTGASPANLVPSSNYEYYVRARCTDGSYSIWTGPIAFATTQISAQLPYTDDFSAPQWTLNNGTQVNTWQINATANTGASGSALFVSNDNGLNNLYTITAGSVVQAYRDIQIPANATFCDFAFEWKGIGQAGSDYVRAYLVPTTLPLVPGTQIVANTTTNIKLAGDFANGLNWTTFNGVVNVAPFAGTTRRLVFEWRNDTFTGSQPPAAIDNVSFVISACTPPLNVVPSAITDTSATISWNPNGSTATSWEVVLRPAGSPAPLGDVTGSVVANQASYPYTNLPNTTSYDVYVRAICSPTNKSYWIKGTSFMTACGIITPPFTETFNNGSPSEVCWTVVDANADNLTWNLNTTYFMYEGDQAASLTKYYNSTSNNDWLISQGIQLNGNQRLKFRYRVVSATYPTDMEVLLSTTGSAPANFTNVLMPQQTINNPAYQQKIVYLDNYTGVVNLAFHVPNVSTNSWTLFIDEVIIEDIPACPDPTALTASNLGNNSATLSWTPGHNETQWEVAVQPQNSGVPTTDGTLVSSNTYSATNLSPATIYEYYVRAVCSATQKSQWVGPYVFNTLVCPAADRCNYKLVINATSGSGTFGSIRVLQNGILVGTVSAFSLTNTGTIAICPNIPFTLEWDYANWATYTASVTLFDSYDETVYSYVKDVTPINTPFYSGAATCTPVECPKPQSTAVTATTTTTATVEWTEPGTASSWELYVVPTGQPAPDANTVGQVVTSHPYTIANLTPGTRYSVYVRSVCGGASGKSTWTLEKIFVTKITNDNCDTAYVLPVSTSAYCDTPYHATLAGATASPQGNVCGIATYANDDVWFEFTASSTSHIIYINNRAGSNTNLNLSKVLYSGSCTSLQQVLCTQGTTVAYNTNLFLTGTNNNNDILVNNLIVGTTYKLRIFSNYSTANDTRFDICIATPAKAIAINESTYTPSQLVTDVLINENCAQIANVTSSTGTNFGAPHNGIAYFNKNGSEFPFNDGIILSTGKASNATGPKTAIQSVTYAQTTPPYSILWPGDQDLFDYITATGTSQGLENFYNASSLEFDFMTYGNELSFNFLFASEDYGLFQCQWGDAFAFFLTDENGNTTNLAVVPGTDSPVSVTSIRDKKYNYDTTGNCDSSNPTSFDKLYDGYKGVSRYASSANFLGHTIPLQAQATVVPGAVYHIKMVIAEKNDGNYDSAIFLDGDSFDVGHINLGDDMLVSDNTAQCSGTNKVLDTGLSTNYFSFIWTKDGAVINGATSSSYTVTENGDYNVTATVLTSGCQTSDSIRIEFYAPIVVNAPQDITLCSATAQAVFNLDLTTTAILYNVANAADYAVSYFETEVLATTGNPADAITGTSAYQSANDAVIYARVESASTGCFMLYTFKTIVTPNTNAVIAFSYADGVCGIASANPAPVKETGFAEGGIFSTADANITIDPVTGIVDLSATQPGTYQIIYTIADSNCVTGGTYQAAITIAAPAEPAISFTYDDTCVAANDNPMPILPSEFVTGGVYSSTTLTVNAQTGEIDLSTAAVGSHTIVYNVEEDATACTSAFSHTATIAILETIAPITQFEYEPEYCKDAGLVIPDLAVGFTLGGNFTSTTGLVIDDLTGAIDITNSAAGTYIVTYAYEGTDACEEDGNTTFEITINALPEFNLGGPYVVCDASNATIQVTGANFNTGTATYNWTFNGSAIAGGASVQTEGFGTYEVTVTTDGGCIAVQSVEVIQNTDAVSINTTEGCDDNVYKLSVLPVNGSYDENAVISWTGPNGFNSSEATISVTDKGTYTVVITTAGGCTGESTVEVSNTSCLIPRGISPNNDGMNDAFDLSGFEVTKISIFNRYGQEVFNYKGAYTNQWYGQGDNGDKLPTGTYYYSFSTSNGENKTGWVYINRQE
ncbi:choice-of-anchor L domain-containing protein [Flavobacterium sp. DG1-102-2]|uniref:choice-of-anchor L domain-containing protein n=1 Tax=Flavobacterium sp. DG1-102-2 TaxID=3081663 RepID=UPI002949A363|nr:choice-of-anchor L domain-containing protein [Flavobacterium sp. DG1-102-2]MDV6170359.1 choice-of-anchor L domain-containing protein [Flavobacterium sp. DG1-102-2]